MSDPEKFIVPIVNLNGSDKDALAMLQHEASVALDAALDAMGRAFPMVETFRSHPRVTM